MRLVDLGHWLKLNAFTDTMRRASLAGWHALPTAITTVLRSHRQYREEQRQKPIGDRVKMGCLSWLVFGPFVVGTIAFVLYWTLLVVVVTAMIAYLLITSLLWGIGATVDVIRHRGADDGDGAERIE